MITLKNIKRFAQMSEETHCYTATVYFDGKKVGTCKNAGHGGPTDVLFDSFDDRNRVHEWVKSLPPIKTDWGEMEQRLEYLVDAKVDEWMNERWLKNHTKRRVLFKLDDTPEDEYETCHPPRKIAGQLKGQLMDKWAYQALDHLRTKYGGRLIAVYYKGENIL